MGIRASLSFRYIAPTTRTAKSSILTPKCTIRHPVWPIVALQRRVRFSARLAGFCGD